MINIVNSIFIVFVLFSYIPLSWAEAQGVSEFFGAAMDPNYPNTGKKVDQCGLKIFQKELDINMRNLSSQILLARIYMEESPEDAFNSIIDEIEKGVTNYAEMKSREGLAFDNKKLQERYGHLMDHYDDYRKVLEMYQEIQKKKQELQAAEIDLMREIVNIEKNIPRENLFVN